MLRCRRARWGEAGSYLRAGRYLIGLVSLEESSREGGKTPRSLNWDEIGSQRCEEREGGVTSAGTRADLA